MDLCAASVLGGVVLGVMLSAIVAGFVWMARDLVRLSSNGSPGGRKPDPPPPPPGGLVQ